MLRYLLVALLSLYSVSSLALITDTSLNPAVAPGPVAYIGDSDGFPTPHQNPATVASVPSPQTIFSPDDPIRIAESISLADLTAADDSGLAAWDLNALVWSVDWYYEGITYIDSNFASETWADIATWKADPNLTQLSFWTDLFVPTTYGPLAEGTWYADTFFEGVYQGTAVFAVPAPTSLLLLIPGLILLSRKLKSNS